MKAKVSQLDLLGHPIGFEENGSTTNKSFCGALLTLCIIIATVIIGFMFGKEIYQRKNPNVSYSKSFLNQSEVYYKDFPFVLNANFPNGTYFSKELYVSLIEFDFKFYDPSRVPPFNDKAYHIEKCNIESLPVFSGVFSKVKCSDEYPCFCIKNHTGLKFYNKHGNVDASFLQIDIKQCKTNCHPDKEKLLSNIMVNFYFANSYVDSSSYNNPIKYFLDKVGLEASNKMQKRNFISITNNVYESDNGWILEDLMSLPFVELADNYVGYNVLSTSSSIIGSFTIDSPQLRNVIKRNYMKVQDLFAKVGGLINALLILLKALTYHYFKYKYYILLDSISKPQQDKITDQHSLFHMNKSLKSNFMIKNPAEITVSPEMKKIPFQAIENNKDLGDSNLILQINDAEKNQIKNVNANNFSNIHLDYKNEESPVDEKSKILENESFLSYFLTTNLCFGKCFKQGKISDTQLRISEIQSKLSLFSFSRLINLFN